MPFQNAHALLCILSMACLTSQRPVKSAERHEASEALPTCAGAASCTAAAGGCCTGDSAEVAGCACPADGRCIVVCAAPVLATSASCRGWRCPAAPSHPSGSLPQPLNTNANLILGHRQKWMTHSIRLFQTCQEYLAEKEIVAAR